MAGNKEKNIKLVYYAVLKDERGCREEVYRTEAKTALELYCELRKKFKFSLAEDRLKVAINGMFKGWDALLENNDEVVFIPPVAGG